MQFCELKRFVRAEAAREGLPCSSRQAHSIARIVMARDIEADLIEDSLGELRLHADPTATEAIRRVMREWIDAKAVAA